MALVTPTSIPQHLAQQAQGHAWVWDEERLYVLDFLPVLCSFAHSERLEPCSLHRNKMPCAQGATRPRVSAKCRPVPSAGISVPTVPSLEHYRLYIGPLRLPHWALNFPIGRW